MEAIYNNKDVQKFLLDKDVLWSGECIKTVHTSYSDEIVADVLFANERVPRQVTITVSPISFLILEETDAIYYEDTETSINELADFSNDWILFLVNKSPESAKVIRQKAIDQVALLNSKCDKELSELEAQKRLTMVKYNCMAKPWNQVIAMANKKLNANAVNDEEEPENQ